MDPGGTVAAGLTQPWASPPSVADVERITALTDPVVRNLQITQCYHELSLALGTRTGNTRTGARSPSGPPSRPGRRSGRRIWRGLSSSCGRRPRRSLW